MRRTKKKNSDQSSFVRLTRISQPNHPRIIITSSESSRWNILHIIPINFSPFLIFQSSRAWVQLQIVYLCGVACIPCAPPVCMFIQVTLKCYFWIMTSGFIYKKNIQRKTQTKDYLFVPDIPREWPTKLNSSIFNWWWTTRIEYHLYLWVGLNSDSRLPYHFDWQL